MSDVHIDAMRAAVQRDAERVLTADDLRDAGMAFGYCRTCAAPRIDKVTEPEPDTFQASWVCTADEGHAP